MTATTRPIRPGSRPGKRWCQWLDAIVTWTPEERAEAREKSGNAYTSRSIRAQYAALGEISALDQAEAGTLKHTDRCVTRGCPHRTAADEDPEDRPAE